MAQSRSRLAAKVRGGERGLSSAQSGWGDMDLSGLPVEQQQDQQLHLKSPWTLVSWSAG